MGSTPIPSSNTEPPILRSLVLRILKGTKKHPVGLAKFKKISAIFDPYRIGRTAKEREIIFQVAHDLFNDRLKGKDIL